MFFSVSPAEFDITGVELKKASGVEPASTYHVLANYTVAQDSEKDALQRNEAMLRSPDLLQVKHPIDQCASLHLQSSVVVC